MKLRVDLTGRRFERITVEHFARRHNARTFWFCVCDCGVHFEAHTDQLRDGLRRACKTCQPKGHWKHGHSPKGTSGTPTFRSWCQMQSRCRNSNRRDWNHYGGRGISICERWSVFENFIADMGERPLGMSLDRINNDGNYEPGNCRWATQSEQVRNRRRKTHCAQGHELSGDNVIHGIAQRICRTCSQDWQRRYREKRKAAA